MPRLLEDRALVLEEAIQCVPEILDEMKPIGDLDGIRSTAGRAVGVEIAAVTTDQGDAGMGGEPGRDAVGGALRQEINGRRRSRSQRIVP